MKKELLFALLLVASFFVVGVASASSSSTQSIFLNAGWNIVSVPRVVESHEFSVPENSTNFDVYILNASSTSGWSTMAEMGQTEFLPLFGYFINNKTSSSQTLTLNYRENLNPSERLFERQFTRPGWYSIGVANPEYAKTQYGSGVDINNASNVLNSLSGNYSIVIDFTHEDYSSTPWSVRVGNQWKAVVPNDLNSLNDLRETKGYAIYLTSSNALYNGFQNEGTSSSSEVSLNIFKDSSFPDTNRTRGAASVKIASFVAQASLGDDIRINNISIDIASSSNIANLKLLGGTTQLGNTINTPSNTNNNFTLSNFVIPRNTSVTFSLLADVLSTATGSVTASLPLSGVSGVGVSSGISLGTSSPSSTIPLQKITIVTPLLYISSAGDMPTSKVVLAGQTGVEIHKIRLLAQLENLTLKKIALALNSASQGSWSTSTLTSNFGTVYLYEGSILLGSGTFNSTDGTVQFSGLNATLLQDTEKVLTVKADIAASSVLNPRSVTALNLYSTSTDYLEVYGSQGLMDVNHIFATSEGTRSNYMLFHDAAPSIVNAMSSGLKVPSTNQEISKFTIANTAPVGGRTLTLDQLAISVTMSGYSPSSTVTTFKLYDENGTEIASSTYDLTATTPSTTLTFASSSPNWVTQSFAAGSSKTFTLKANTTNIRTGLSSGSSVYLSTKIDGLKGYNSSNSTSELFWNDGGVNYRYTQAGTLTVFSNNTASDSYPVDGATITY